MCHLERQFGEAITGRVARRRPRRRTAAAGRSHHRFPKLSELSPAFENRLEQRLHFREWLFRLLEIRIDQASLHVVVKPAQLRAQIAALFEVKRSLQFADNQLRLCNSARPLSNALFSDAHAGVANRFNGPFIGQRNQL